MTPDLDPARLGPTTRAVHAAPAESSQDPAASPIYQSATFLFHDLEEFAESAKTKISGGYVYSRWRNPTVDATAAIIASLEGAEASFCFASGMGAISTTLLATAAGGHVVAASQLYGGTHSLIRSWLPRFGMSGTLVDMCDPQAAKAAITPQTKLLYCETIGNPAMRVADVEAWGSVASEAGLPLVVDATFTPPVMLRPIEHGATLVLHSTTKYMGGHSDHLGGVVSGPRELVDPIQRLQIDLGATMAPFEAFLLARGLQTLDLRVTRQSSNAQRIAEWLQEHPAVEAVRYPGLTDHPDHALAKTLFGDRCGGMLAVDLAGGFEAGIKAMSKVSLFGRAASLGSTKSLIVHPASVTHTQLNEQQLLAAGMRPGTLRISVGIEDAEDLIADLEQALS